MVVGSWNTRWVNRMMGLSGSISTAEVEHWSMTTLRERLVKIGARIVRHGRSIIFQMAEVMVPRGLFEKILSAIAALRPLPPARC